ncbi:ACTIN CYTOSKELETON-REGULATORY COMPLEX PAN-LIKE PROTEIN [Salix purpurea]|uniref:ACTIN CYTOSKELETON-REGULATORY COMPLEX PAN-LIKE PROTEIN n=1 Tax=Salix purpurea TaxID=77065 RepID=A0A9Q0WR89_SALPP|nr:ACTIN CYTOSKELETON-REGULATORY COMPLEX PAN-LIKE PROTEIN [Salix purpurea]
MEGATRWNPVCLERSDELQQSYSQLKCLDQQVSAVSVVSALEAELEQARACIQELEIERQSSKKKVEHFLKKVSEKRAAWRSREHEKIHASFSDIKSDLSREKKNRRSLESVNSKLVSDLANAKVSAKRHMQDCEKERKARELIEEVCDELAKEIGEDKAEVEALKRESLKLREEVDEERRMLQMAEVWREERVQMKLVDAKVAIEEKYSCMNNLVADLEAFIRSRSATQGSKEMKEAESVIQAASVHIQDIKEFMYEPPNQDDIFSAFEEVNFAETNYRENNHGHSGAFAHQNGDMEEEESGWETVSHLEDEGSSYSPDGSIPSVNKNCQESNVSGRATGWEGNACDETPITEISDVCSLPRRQLKASSITRFRRSCPFNGDNYKTISVDGLSSSRLSNARKSNAGMVSPDKMCGESGLGPPDLVGQWSSPDSVNRRITRGMKGCVEWPLGHKNSLKSKLLEARMESQRVQLRHVLRQKI